MEFEAFSKSRNKGNNKKMDGDRLISAIMPVYNTSEKYLRKCIESVLAQSYGQFELIIIDNGSIKSIGNICDAYAYKDNRIVVIHQENRGVSGARNRGLELIHGKYLTFVDSDDILSENAWERALAEIQDMREISCVVFGWRRKCEDQYNDIKIVQQKTILSNLEVIKAIAIDDNKYGGGYPWNKIWKMDSEEKALIKFEEDIYAYEDKLWTIAEMKLANKVLLLPDILYTYRIHQDSLTNTKPQERIINVLQAEWKILDYIESVDERIYKHVLQENFRKTYFELRNQFRRHQVIQNSAKVRALRIYLKKVSRRIKVRDLKKMRYIIACIFFRMI